MVWRHKFGGPVPRQPAHYPHCRLFYLCFAYATICFVKQTAPAVESYACIPGNRAIHCTINIYIYGGTLCCISYYGCCCYSCVVLKAVFCGTIHLLITKLRSHVFGLGRHQSTQDIDDHTPVCRYLMVLSSCGLAGITVGLQTKS